MNEHLIYLHVECVRRLREYIAEANKTCKLLTAIKDFPVPLAMRAEILEQRRAENAAHEKYQSARLELFRAAEWAH